MSGGRTRFPGWLLVNRRTLQVLETGVDEYSLRRVIYNNFFFFTHVLFFQTTLTFSLSFLILFSHSFPDARPDNFGLRQTEETLDNSSRPAMQRRLRKRTNRRHRS